MQDLVAVGVADAGHERLVAQQVLELARVPPDPLAPDLEGQGRVVGVGSLLGRRRGPGTGRSTPAGTEVDLAHLGRVAVADLGAGVVRRQPGRAARPRRGIARARGPRAEPEDDRGLGRQLVARRRQLEPAGQHRVAGDLVALEVDEQELAAPADRTRPAGRRAPRARPACRAPRAARAPRRSVIGRPASGGVEGIGDHGQIGQFGHGAAIVAVGRRVLDSPGPKGQDS